MDGDRASGPLGLRPGDPVRLKRLQANQAMNGLIGYFVKIETEEDGGRYVVELGKRGPVRVREINVEKVSPSRRSTRLATAAAAEAAALAEEPEAPKTKTPASKAKAKAKSMSRRPLRGAAKAKTAVKKTGNKVIKPKPAGGGGVFDVNMYKICSEPTLEEKAKEFKAKAKAKSMSRKPLHGAAKAKSAVKKTGNKVIKPKPAGGGTCTKSVLNPPWRCKMRSAPNGDPATYIKM